MTDKKIDKKPVEKKKFFKCPDCEKLKAECEEYKNGWQRALADYRNLQNDTEKKRGEMLSWTEEKILDDFIPVYENFKKAFAVETTDETGKSWREGIGYIMKQFADILKNYGIEEITTVGEKLDLNLHEAVGEEEMEGKESGEIIREVSGGYKKGEKVLLPSKVIVAK